MPKVIEGKLVSKGKKYGVVVSRFNEFISSKLLGGALDTLRRHGVNDDEITVVWTPGSWEIPLVAKKMASSTKYDAVIALGAVIRGGTPHFEYVAGEAASGLQLAGLETGVPVAFGVLTTDTLEQALARVDKGAEAVRTALEMADVFSQLRSTAQAAR